MKKLILSLITILVISVGTLFAINGKNNYDPTKYHTIATNGINIGSKLSIKLPDQFDKAHEVTNDTKEVIFVFAKATGHTVRKYLKQQPKDFLPSRHTLFIADISGMPSIIANMFAIPDMKKSKYPILLTKEKATSQIFKVTSQKNAIMIITLDNKI